MQVTELESKGLKKNFKIVVGADAINTQTESELKAAGQNLKIPGFRPGYVPMKVLQQRYGKSVQADVINKLINRSVGDVVSQRKLRPALTPQINIEDYKEGGELAFSMAVEVFPELPEFSFDGVTLARKTFEVEEKDIDEALERIAARTPQFSALAKDAKAALGNVVKIDFKGSIDGELFAGGTASNFELELGSKQFIEGFEEQLVGAKAGDVRTVKVKFPDQYPGAQVAGKNAEFEVTVHEVLEAKPAVIDDAFAKARNFADVRALREAVRVQIIKEYDQAVRSQLKKQLFDVLEEKYNFELPESMVDMEFSTIWERVKQSREEGDEALAGKNEDELRDEYRQIAQRRVKLGILLAEVGTRNKIQISRDEISRAVMQQASQFPGQEKQIFEFYQKNPDRLEDLRGPILEEKAVDFILSKVKFNDTKTALDALVDAEEDEAEPKKKPAAKTKSKKKSAE